ncbi:hypothetical protein [Nonomuraea gerenzanensis]|uniref:Uncharacterized protein n=1 Tax=Nonomuraea gerenzanensis TaxID=93944 RepID=A0A1M4E5K7_9ACTN|nr:hypothetical protein [Nonomuraea gerenzanensis]UBU16240.1 hypothetical protein LCN96_14860 [Nonomuraea gerenzanensis]SBO94054.1 hypothetical protein BN4615_P3570 [Nonomuraea gerenzanensis]
MRETELRETLDRAVEDAVLPAGMGERAIAGARARRRRLRVAAAGAAIVAGGAGLALPLVLGPAVSSPPAGTTSASVSASVSASISARPEGTVSARPEAGPVERLSAQLGRPVNALVYGQAGAETLVVVPRRANEQDGKAAELWAATEGAPFRQVSDYLSYDLACERGDEVCERTRPSGLGFAALRVAHGRVFVIVAIAPGRSATVTTPEGTSTAVPAAGIAETRTARPWEIEIRVSTADGTSYVLPLPPGGVVEG